MDEYSWAEILYCLFFEFSSFFVEEDLIFTSRKKF